VRYSLTKGRPPNDAWIRASRLRRPRLPRISVVLRGFRSGCGAVGLQVLVVCRATGGAGIFPVVAVSAVAGGCSARSYFGSGRDGDTGRVAGGSVFLGGPDRPSAVDTGLFAESAVSFVPGLGSAFGRRLGARLGYPNGRCRLARWLGPLSLNPWTSGVPWSVWDTRKVPFDLR